MNGGLVARRAAEIVDAWWMARAGVTPRRAERAVHRVLVARGRESAHGIVYPPAAVLYLPPDHYQRTGVAIAAELPAMRRRIAERLGPGCPASFRLSVRPDACIRRPQVAAPTVAGIRRDTDRTLVDATLIDPKSPVLALRPSDGAFPPIPVPENGLVVGRNDRRLRRLLDSRVSRDHLELTPVGGGVVSCRDLGSRNGTWVDGTRVTGTVRLRPGQRLRVGDTEFQLVMQDAADRGGGA
ncbi:FHA domain-containing protein [Actinoplanes sp. NPDC051851]|uniref:FHA domain-containing protein n=1 Tax=Actinoplanes sp. NPDC051851 TaxID=3154753 RepID=UPI00341FB3CD